MLKEVVYFRNQKPVCACVPVYRCFEDRKHTTRAVQAIRARWDAETSVTKG